MDPGKKPTQYQCKQQLRSKQALDLMCIDKGAQPINIYISSKRVLEHKYLFRHIQSAYLRYNNFAHCYPAQNLKRYFANS